MFNLILFQEAEVLLSKGAPGVMQFLIADVVDDAGQLRVSVRERAKALLPSKSPQHPTFAVEEIGGTVFYVAHQIGERHGGFETDQDMCVVGHAVDGQELLPAFPDDAGNILMEFLLVLFLDEILSTFDGKDNLEVDLRVSIRHVLSIVGVRQEQAIGKLLSCRNG